MKINKKMKKTGYILLLICFVWSIGITWFDKGDFEIVKFWVSTSLFLIFGNTAKTIIGEKVKSTMQGKVDV